MFTQNPEHKTQNLGLRFSVSDTKKNLYRSIGVPVDRGNYKSKPFDLATVFDTVKDIIIPEGHILQPWINESIRKQYQMHSWEIVEA